MNKILPYFFKEPEKEFYVRQISKLLKNSPTTISKYLKKLEQDGVLKSERKLNHLIFKANTENEKFRRLKTDYNLNLVHESGFVEYLAEEFNHPEVIILFGSFSKGENIKKSDIDIFILSQLKKDINLKKFEERMGYKIQLFINSKKDVEKMKVKNRELLNNIINGKIIYGFWEVF